MCSIVKIPRNFHAMSIKPINKKTVNVERKERDKNEFLLQVDLVSTSDKSTEEYLDRYEGVTIRNTKYN